jgi:hypothetical protein
MVSLTHLYFQFAFTEAIRHWLDYIVVRTLTFLRFRFLLTLGSSTGGRILVKRFSLGSLRGGGGGDGMSSPPEGDVPSPGRMPSANVTDLRDSAVGPPNVASSGFSLQQ